MATRDELYEWVDVSTFSDPEPKFIRGRKKAVPPGDGQPIHNHWDCPYCGSLHKDDVLKCSQCGAHKRKGQ